MKLKKSLPPGRTIDQIRNHYEVEKAIATRLRRADREERKRIYRTMYDDLFRLVPDHPRLTRGRSAEQVALSNRKKLAVVSRFTRADTVFAEFAPGDCRFAVEIARRVERVYAIDISDQRDRLEKLPPNMRLIIYDGYHLDLPDGSVDIAFSDHLIEHIHPEDTMLHFQLVRRILKPGGVYLFRTPHARGGPHDISGYFSDEPEGFHIKEWTYRELKRVIAGAGFRRFFTYANRRDIVVRLPYSAFSLYEHMLDLLPSHTAKRISLPLLPNICAAAIK